MVIVEELERLGVVYRVVPRFYHFMSHKVRIENLDSIPLLTRPVRSTGFLTRVTKRALDVVLALFILALTMPFFVLSALLIKRESPGPVFFLQTRIGQEGRPFRMIKFRTMHAHMSGDAPAPKSHDDPRITRIGKWLRRYSLDELPQVLNVLRGEMSVVGPRPEQPGFVDRLERVVPFYQRRHLMKPGLTGWAQVRCGYAGSDSGSAWKLCHDLFYLKHQSLGLDLAILAETARTLVADRQFPRHADRGAPEFVALTAVESAARVQPAGELTAAATR